MDSDRLSAVHHALAARRGLTALQELDGYMGLCLEWVGFRSDCMPYLPSLVALLKPFQRLHLCADYQASKVR